MKTRTIALTDLHPDPQNARKHNSRNIGMIADSIGEVGVSRSGVIDEEGTILAGNGTFEALTERGIKRVQVIETDGEEWVVVQRSGLTEEQKRKLSIADNRASDLATWDGALLKAQDVDLAPFFSAEELSVLNSEMEQGENGKEAGRGEGEDRKTLSDRFLVPPFSVLDARQGYWQDRKRAWLSLGIESELGRGGAPGGSPRPAAQLTDSGHTVRGDGTGKPIQKSTYNDRSWIKEKGLIGLAQDANVRGKL